MSRKLPRAFYTRDPATVARALLGKRLVRVFRRRRYEGVIVETEAYLGAADAAAHTFGGRRTERVRSMYLEGGHAYVYFVYGMHYCVNVVAGAEDEGVAVLIRALMPAPRLRGRTDGPARLCRALHIDRRLDGEDLRGKTIFIEDAPAPAEEEIGRSARIGVEYAGHAARWPLRFFWKGNPHLSVKEKR